MLLNIWLSAESTYGSDMVQALSISIRLLDSIISFPFSQNIIES